MKLKVFTIEPPSSQKKEKTEMGTKVENAEREAPPPTGEHIKMVCHA